MWIPLAAAAALGTAYWMGRNHNSKDMALTKQSLLQALALVSAALATSASDRVKLAESEKQLDQFKKDHDLVNDPEVNDILAKVLQAAQEAPVSAAATTAAEATADFLDANNDGIDDRLQQQPGKVETETGTVDTQNSGSEPNKTDDAADAPKEDGANGDQYQSDETARGEQAPNEENS